jgi:hypothetical protein
MSVAGAILRLSTLLRSRTSSPLSRSAGEGPGVRAARTIPNAGGRPVLVEKRKAEMSKTSGQG